MCCTNCLLSILALSRITTNNVLIISRTERRKSGQDRGSCNRLALFCTEWRELWIFAQNIYINILLFILPTRNNSEQSSFFIIISLANRITKTVLFYLSCTYVTLLIKLVFLSLSHRTTNIFHLYFSHRTEHICHLSLSHRTQHIFHLSLSHRRGKYVSFISLAHNITYLSFISLAQNNKYCSECLSRDQKNKDCSFYHSRTEQQIRIVLNFSLAQNLTDHSCLYLSRTERRRSLRSRDAICRRCRTKVFPLLGRAGPQGHVCALRHSAKGPHCPLQHAWGQKPNSQTILSNLSYDFVTFKA